MMPTPTLRTRPRAPARPQHLPTVPEIDVDDVFTVERSGLVPAPRHHQAPTTTAVPSASAQVDDGQLDQALEEMLGFPSVEHSKGAEGEEAPGTGTPGASEASEEKSEPAPPQAAVPFRPGPRLKRLPQRRLGLSAQARPAASLSRRALLRRRHARAQQGAAAAAVGSRRAAGVKGGREGRVGGEEEEGAGAAVRGVEGGVVEDDVEREEEENEEEEEEEEESRTAVVPGYGEVTKPACLRHERIEDVIGWDQNPLIIPRGTEVPYSTRELAVVPIDWGKLPWAARSSMVNMLAWLVKAQEMQREYPPGTERAIEDERLRQRVVLERSLSLPDTKLNRDTVFQLVGAYNGQPLHESERELRQSVLEAFRAGSHDAVKGAIEDMGVRGFRNACEKFAIPLKTLCSVHPNGFGLRLGHLLTMGFGWKTLLAQGMTADDVIANGSGTVLQPGEMRFSWATLNEGGTFTLREALRALPGAGRRFCDTLRALDVDMTILHHLGLDAHVLATELGVPLEELEQLPYSLDQWQSQMRLSPESPLFRRLQEAKWQDPGSMVAPPAAGQRPRGARRERSGSAKDRKKDKKKSKSKKKSKKAKRPFHWDSYGSEGDLAIDYGDSEEEGGGGGEGQTVTAMSMLFGGLFGTELNGPAPDEEDEEDVDDGDEVPPRSPSPRTRRQMKKRKKKRKSQHKKERSPRRRRHSAGSSGSSSGNQLDMLDKLDASELGDSFSTAPTTHVPVDYGAGRLESGLLGGIWHLARFLRGGADTGDARGGGGGDGGSDGGSDGETEGEELERGSVSQSVAVPLREMQKRRRELRHLERVSGRAVRYDEIERNRALVSEAVPATARVQPRPTGAPSTAAASAGTASDAAPRRIGQRAPRRLTGATAPAPSRAMDIASRRRQLAARRARLARPGGLG